MQTRDENSGRKISLLGKSLKILPRVNSQRNHEISSKKDMRAFNEKRADLKALRIPYEDPPREKEERE